MYFNRIIQSVFTAQPGHGSDYLAIGIKDGHIVFQFDLGTGKIYHHIYYNPVGVKGSYLPLVKVADGSFCSEG